MAFWNPESIVTLYRVPWDSSYDNVVDWKTTDRDAYFASLPSKDVITKSDSAYMPLGMQIVIDLPYEVARKFNYCVVSNPANPVEGDEDYKLYYFITNTGYPNPSASVLTCSLDVWTTRYTDIKFNVGYVERGHIGMANSNLVNAPEGGYTKALNTYCTQADGVSTGDQYQTFKVDAFQINDPEQPSYVCVVSTCKLYGGRGTVDNPQLKTADGNLVDGIVSGCNVYFIAIDDIRIFMSDMADFPWISQNIISICTVPNKLINFDYLEDKTSYYNERLYHYYVPNRDYSKSFNWNFGDIPWLSDDAVIDIANLKSKERWGQSTDAKYWYQSIDKLNAYPYAVIELTSSSSGQSVFLKPELLGSDVTPLVYISCAIQPFASCAVAPKYYGHFDGKQFSVTVKDGDEVSTRDIPYGELFNCAIWFDNFPQWSIVNNAYLAYMASTAHTRTYQYDNALWGMNSSNLTAQNSYKNSRISISNAYANAKIEADRTRDVFAENYAQSQTEFGVNAVTGGINLATNVIGSFANPTQSPVEFGANFVGSAANYVGGVVTGLSGLEHSQNINKLNLAALRQSAKNTRNSSREIAENNLALASTVNQGNYDNEIQGIDAAYADAKLTQPSQSGNTGGDGLRYANGIEWLIEVRYKTLCDDAIVRNGDFFRRFGYAVNRYMNIPNDLSLCKYWTYWKVQQLETSSALMNEDEKNVIKGIFAKGVSVWTNPDEIGTIYPRANRVLDDKIRDYY